MPIKNILRLLRAPAGSPAIYDVEKETLSWASLHAKFYLARYAQDPTGHWTEKEERNNYVGMVGHKIFDLICQQYNVPNDRNDPVIDWRSKKLYDFLIPKLGTIEVKTVDYGLRKVLVKVAEWHGNDYLVVFRFMDFKPSVVHLIGWLTRQQVEKLPISKKGQMWEDGTCYTPLADAYITDFDKLNSANQFISMLQQKSMLRVGN